MVKWLSTAAATASGTAIDFTSIPSWAKRITVMLDGVSTNGSQHTNTNREILEKGENTGYFSTASSVSSAVQTSGSTTDIFFRNNTSTFNYSGVFNLCLNSLNKWNASGVFIIKQLFRLPTAFKILSAILRQNQNNNSKWDRYIPILEQLILCMRGKNNGKNNNRKTNKCSNW